MSNLILPQTVWEVDAEDEQTLAAIMNEIRQLNALMQQDQAKIERLKTESRAYRDEAQAIKAETKKIGAETRIVLDRLNSEVR